MKRAILLLIVLTGCQLEYGDYTDITFDIPKHGFTTVAEVVRWTAANITYTSEKKEYWQTPEQTYRRRTGDCEDFTILAMYMVYTEVGIKPVMMGGASGKYQHAWLGADGWWEPQGGYACPWYAEMYGSIHSIKYGEVMYRAVETKRSLDTAYGSEL